MPVYQLDVPAASGTFLPTGDNGTAIPVQHLKPWKSITAHGVNSGTFSLATIQPQASNDGSNWVALGDPITTDGIYSYVTMMQFLRIHMTAYTSGTQTAWLSAHSIHDA